MRNSLNLMGDGDELDVLSDVERTFGIKITDKEAQAPRNVGDLYDLIEAKCAADGTNACLSQASFYRLREALKAMGVRSVIAPGTLLAEIGSFAGREGRAKWYELERRSGLTFPKLETAGERGALGLWWLRQRTPGRIWLSALATMPIVAGLLFFFHHFLSVHPQTIPYWIFGAPVALALIFAAARFAWYLAFRTVPKRILTIGDLALEAAGYSFAELTRTKHGSSPHDRWSALCAILRLDSGHKSDIAKDTKFFVSEPS